VKALELVDEAIDVLREYARERPEKAEALEDILYALEEASEELDRLVSAEERG
jgi:acyl-CoA reductase-like NAD-dependent aldehyde dehydrogenase